MAELEELESKLGDLEALVVQALEVASHHSSEHGDEGRDPFIHSAVKGHDHSHGPIWLPPSHWTVGSTNGRSTQGPDPSSMDIIPMSGSNTTYHHALVLLPDDWIAGGITWKLHYRKSGTNAGDFVFEIDYGHIAAGENPLAVGANLDKTFTPADNTNYQIETIGTSVTPSTGDLIRLVMRRAGGESGDTSSDAMHFIGLEGEYV